MWQISLPRIQRYAMILGAVGAVVVLLVQSPRDAIGFLVGAAISIVTIQSWGRLAESLSAAAAAGTGETSQVAPHAAPGGKKPAAPTAAASFMALRYVLIGAAMYASIKVLGVTPVAMLAGLLVSFLAVVIELLYQVFKPR